MIGQLLTGRYLILERLGAGGFSETYLARDKYLPHHPLCVAKCLKLSPTNTIPLAVAQCLFETEARVLSELGEHHAQIPTLLAYNHEQEMAYQIQQYIEGKNLGQSLLQGQRLNSETAIALLMDVLPILQFVHSHHVVHRDIKPSNLIQSTQTNRIVLIDFGAACRVTETASGLTLERENADLAIGTPGFMPKEQQQGQLQFSSDLYALGASVAFLLTGVHPRKLQPNPISGELDWQVHLGERSIHPGLALVLGGMLRYRACDRYQTATEVMTAMQSFVSFGVPDTPAKSQPIVLRRWQKRSRQWFLAGQRSWVIMALTLGLLGAGYWYVHNRQSNNLMAQLEAWPTRSSHHLRLIRAMPMTSVDNQLLIAVSDRRLVTANSSHGIQIWSLPEGRLERTLFRHSQQMAISLSRNGEWLVSADSDRTVHLWHLESGAYKRYSTGQEAAITAVAISPDAQTIASSSQDGMVRLWNCRTGSRQQTLARFGSAITAMTYGARSDQLISANSNYELQIWDLNRHQLQRTFAGHTAPVMHLQMIDSQTLVSVGQDRSNVWNLHREELIRSSAKYSTTLTAATVHDRQVATINQQGRIQFWDFSTGRSETTRENGQSSLRAALSANGHYLVTWGVDRQLRLWQLGSQ